MGSTRLLNDTAVVHLAGPAGATSWGPRDRGRRFVSGIASAEVDDVLVRYRRVGATGDSAAEATLLRLDAARAEQIGSPGPVTLYVAEIPPNRETCGGGEVVARSGWLTWEASRGLSGLARNISARESRCAFDVDAFDAGGPSDRAADSLLGSLARSVIALF